MIKNSKSFFEFSLIDLYKKKRNEQLKSKNPLRNYFNGFKQNSNYQSKFIPKNNFNGFMKKVSKKNSIEKINFDQRERKSCRIDLNSKKSGLEKTKIFSKSKDDLISARKLLSNDNLKQTENMKKIDFEKIFKIENYLFEFADAINTNKDVYNIFKDYIDFVQESNFSIFLKLIKDKKMGENFKIGFILERAVMMIIFYITINENNKEDKVFLHKILIRVYSTIYIFITFLIDNFFNDMLIKKNKEYLDVILNRNFKAYNIKIEENIDTNNKKIFSYLTFLLKNFEKTFSSEIFKLKEFIEDLNLEEGLNFLIKIFNKAYEEKGVTKTEGEVSPQKLPEGKKDYTLVLDLDETLVHYSEEEGGKVNFRPHLESFLFEVKKHFEVIIFTASKKEYADIILDYLDPDKSIIKERYYREHLKENENSFFKDLSILKKDISKVIIIDNLPDNFREQKDNGIFIQSWYSDVNDTALLNLLPVLLEIVEKQVKDVREFLKCYKTKMIEHIQKGSLNPNFVLKDVDEKKS